jgi:hypothetical protein
LFLGSLDRVLIGIERVPLSLSPFSSHASRKGLASRFRGWHAPVVAELW